MIKKTAILALSTVLASQLMGAEDLSEMLKEGKAGGYVRLHHIIEGLTQPGIAYTGSVIAGKLKYQTGALHGLRFGTALYTSHDTGLTDTDRRGTSQIAGGLLGDNFDGYSTLGEAYANYHISNTDITYGRQEFKTPMTEAAVTFIPNLFEGTVATIKELPNTTITAAHISKMQYGTRSLTERNLLGDETYGITAGTGITHYVSPTNQTEGGLTPIWGKESFQDMGLAMFGRSQGGAQRVDSSGVFSLGIDYKSGDFKARVWDYYAHDMYNTIYADAEYKMDVGAAKVTLAAQGLKQNDVGDFQNGAGGNALKGVIGATRLPIYGIPATTIYRTKISEDGSIDALFWGAKAKAEIGDLTLEAAFNRNEDGHVINTWGGDPGFTSTIFSRNEFRADTTAYKLGLEYSLQSFVPGLKFIYNHAGYDSDVQTWNTTGTSKTGVRRELTRVHDYVLHYAVPSVKGLWVRLFHVDRYSATREYQQGHTRLVANLSF